ncbi:MAG: hypothetical protein HC898_01565 [Phycisphaerales bacterium]|nr:hypothetical protein [Phycisphaerales bacterium]
MNKQGFTGRVRQRKTSRRVFWADHAARLLIMIGGIGTIVAVLTVFIFLGSVIIPLFTGSSIESAGRTKQVQPLSSRPIATGVDEYQVMGWVLMSSGELQVFRADTGAVLEKRALVSPGEGGGLTLVRGITSRRSGAGFCRWFVAHGAD